MLFSLCFKYLSIHLKLVLRLLSNTFYVFVYLPLQTMTKNLNTTIAKQTRCTWMLLNETSKPYKQLPAIEGSIFLLFYFYCFLELSYIRKTLLSDNIRVFSLPAINFARIGKNKQTYKLSPADTSHFPELRSHMSDLFVQSSPGLEPPWREL